MAEITTAQRERWEKIRSRGKRHFVTKYGVFGFGGPMALFGGIAFAFDGTVSFLPGLGLAAAICLPMGAVFGSVMWAVNNRAMADAIAPPVSAAGTAPDGDGPTAGGSSRGASIVRSQAARAEFQRSRTAGAVSLGGLVLAYFGARINLKAVQTRNAEGALGGQVLFGVGILLWAVLKSSRNRALFAARMAALHAHVARDEISGRALSLLRARYDVLLRTDRWKRFLGVLLVGYLVVVPGGNLLAWLRAGSLGADVPPWATIQTGLFGVGVLVLGIWQSSQVVLLRPLRKPRVILVLRRFRRRERETTVLSEIVGTAAAGLGTPITVQDDSFKGAMPIGMKVTDVWVTMLMPLFMLFAILLFMQLPGASGVDGSLLVLGGAAVPLLLYASVWRWIKWRVAVPRSPGTPGPFVSKVIHTMRRSKGGHAGTRAILLPDAHWQDGIRGAIDNADAIVFDVTEISPSVEWELRQVFETHPPEMVLLARGTSEHTRIDPATADELKDDSIARLARIVPEEALRRCRFLAYRLKNPDRSLRGSVLSELDFELAMCLAAGGARDRLRAASATS